MRAILVMVRRWLTGTTAAPEVMTPGLPVDYARPEPWTDEDREAWLKFLQRDTGQKLLNKARWAVQVNLVSAAGLDDPASRALMAAGFANCLDYLASLTSPKSISRTSREQEESTQEEKGVLRLREQLAP